MASASFDIAPLWAPSLPPPAAKWTGFPKYNFTGGKEGANSGAKSNDAEVMPSLFL